MSTLGRLKHFSFSGIATKRNLAVMEINDYINNSASRWKIENRRNGIGQLLFHPISGISGYLDFWIVVIPPNVQSLEVPASWDLDFGQDKYSVYLKSSVLWILNCFHARNKHPCDDSHWFPLSEKNLPFKKKLAIHGKCYQMQLSMKWKRSRRNNIYDWKDGNINLSGI